MSFLLVVGMGRPGGMAYYLSVSEFVASPERDGGDFRINGKVADGSITRHFTGQDVSFLITDGSASLGVDYHGIIPDTMVDGADVVVEGELRADGTFEAHTLLAKCPSKYEAAEDGPVTEHHPEEIPKN
jgi:cytochrome c-type biogenesis protein CcmE